MKAKTVKEKGITLTLRLRFDDPEDIKRFYVIFNHTRVIEPIGFQDQAGAIRGAIKQALGDKIPNLSSCNKLWNALDKHITPGKGKI